MKKFVETVVKAVWSHRAVYAALAGAYGALCLGADKEVVNHCVAGFYAALALQRGY
jgi:hypothetical protein